MKNTMDYGKARSQVTKSDNGVVASSANDISVNSHFSETHFSEFAFNQKHILINSHFSEFYFQAC